MKSKIQQIIPLLLGTLLLLSIPITALILDWHWLPSANSDHTLFPLFLITETASMPYAPITSILLALIILWHCKLPTKKSLILLTLMTSIILTGQVTKSLIKNYQKEPRPYVVWLENTGYISSVNKFYALTRLERATFIDQQNFTQHHIPTWLVGHWKKETGYSFPSGHSIFVASWALIAFAILFRKKAYLTMTVIALWGLSVETSRLLLGMHRTQDIILSCLLAILIVYLAQVAWGKWVFEEDKI